MTVSIRQQVIEAVVKVLTKYDDFSKDRTNELGKDVTDDIDLDDARADLKIPPLNCVDFRIKRDNIMDFLNGISPTTPEEM